MTVEGTAKRWHSAIVLLMATLLTGCTRPVARKVIVLSVSRPRTIATLPADFRYWFLSWLDRDTLVVNYLDMSVGKPVLSGVAGIDIRRGDGQAILPPRLVGGSPRPVFDSGKGASDHAGSALRLPPLRFKKGGALSFDRPRPSPVSRRIAYNVEVVGSDGRRVPKSPHRGLWISRGNGSQPRHVASWTDWPATWSPDGRALLFWTQRPSGKPGLWACRSDGRGVRQIASGRIGVACVSPDSRSVAFTRTKSGKSGLYITRLRGGRPRLLAQDVWSPVWVKGAVLCITKTTKTKLNVIPGRRQPVRQRLPFESIVAIDPSTGARRTIEDFAPLQWSSRSMIAPAKDVGVFVLVEPIDSARRDYSVCALTSEGLGRVPLPPNIDWPAWSPDGRRLAYIDESEIKVVDVSLKTVKQP